MKNLLEPISLEAMDKVKLMNRTDRKYCININSLEGLLEDIRESYYILELGALRDMPYLTVYYDTMGDDMFSNHHRGKMNRYKVRKRCYESTGVTYIEIKFKNNKGRTIKVRQKSEMQGATLTSEDKVFIEANSPYTASSLKEVLCNNFNRLMLVSKDMNERCTIDTSLMFKSDTKEKYINNLAIIEVKTEGRSRSVMIDALSARRVKISGFSKYCIGRSKLDNEVKKNRFKSKLRILNKLI